MEVSANIIVSEETKQNIQKYFINRMKVQVEKI